QSQRFLQEKELIEVVAGKEKEISLLRREVYRRDDELHEKGLEAEALRKALAEAEAERDLAVREGQRREAELLLALGGRETVIAGQEQDLEAARDQRVRLVRELDARLAEEGRRRREEAAASAAA